MSFSIFVRGIPRPKGSMRAFSNRRTGQPIIVADNKPTMRQWERAIQWAVQEKWDGPPAEGPMILRLDFVFPRPKSMPKRRPKYWVDVKPDLDKLARLVEDALQGIAYKDDAQVASEALTKAYGDETGVHIFVDALPQGQEALL